MCQFVSLLIFGPKLSGLYGEIVSCSDHSNSHSATEKWLGLAVRNDFAWAKVEIAPTKGPLDFDAYRFELGEYRKPDWWTDEHQSRALAYGIAEARRLVKVDDLGRITHWPGDISPDLLAQLGDTSALQTIGGYLDCSGNGAATFDVLTTIGGYLDCRGNGAATFDVLESVNGRPYKRPRLRDDLK